MSEPFSVAIADDHPTFLEGLKLVVSCSPGMRLVGTATTSAGIVALAADQRPDVVVLDIRMPDFSGIEATAQIVAGRPEARVMILSSFDREEYVVSAIRSGACGYLLKTSPLPELVQAITAVASGHLVFGSGIATQVAHHFRRPGPTPHFPQLTNREREVLALVAAGFRNGEIARQLRIKPKTVQNHLSNIFTELGVADRAEAIARAREAGLT
ncbi:DNA-binding response regulator [Planobispora rosea]|uniref:DNA-binding response regulator n=1 Tax=Planobispora rosea TaxID=35762 RepID=A0A8J3RSA6_PLARO|nr:response regulator transcription factor [Planobispora rosea]GGS68866.1 DNA-binding response regulator [Planobispora rosea]GIH82061.1 DNA-binding response regulator [Planobispora rosea]